MQSLKENKVKQLIEMFEQTMNAFTEKNFKPQQLLAKNLREEAVKTMRKLPVFGYNNQGNYKTDYEWPTAADILEMPEG